MFFPAQKKGNDSLFIETYFLMLWFARRQAGARKVRKYKLFAKAEQKLEKILKNMLFEQQREHFGGQSLAFSWKNQCFYSSSITENFYFMLFSEAKSVPKIFFGAPKARILLAFRTFPCLPRRIAKSPVFYGEIMAFVDRKTRFLFFSPSKLD